MEKEEFIKAANIYSRLVALDRLAEWESPDLSVTLNDLFIEVNSFKDYRDGAEEVRMDFTGALEDLTELRQRLEEVISATIKNYYIQNRKALEALVK